MSEESDLLATLTSLLSDNSENDQKEEKKEPDNSDSPFDMDMILKLSGVFSDFNSDDERSKLLKDLKPFLSPERRDKIDNAIKILKLLKIAQKAKSENLF